MKKEQVWMFSCAILKKKTSNMSFIPIFTIINQWKYPFYILGLPNLSQANPKLGDTKAIKYTKSIKISSNYILATFASHALIP